MGTKSAAGRSFEGETDSGNKDKNTQEQRAPVSQPPATQVPQYSLFIKKHQVTKGQGSVIIHVRL